MTSRCTNWLKPWVEELGKYKKQIKNKKELSEVKAVIENGIKILYSNNGVKLVESFRGRKKWVSIVRNQLFQS